jgi:hypothetical protein
VKNWGLGALLLVSACGAPGTGAAEEANTAAVEDVTPAASPVAAEPTPPAATNDAAPADTAAPADDPASRSAARLRTLLVAVGQVDGKPITDVRLPERCVLELGTAAAPVRINLAKLGNYASRDAGSRTELPLTDDAGSHTISVDNAAPEPNDDAGARTDMMFSVVAGECRS